MNKILLIVLAFIPTAAFSINCSQEKAVILAKEQFETKYPNYKQYEPYAAKSTNNKWVVYGTLPEFTLGGTPQADILQKTCKVLKVYATR